MVGHQITQYSSQIMVAVGKELLTQKWKQVTGIARCYTDEWNSVLPLWGKR